MKKIFTLLIFLSFVCIFASGCSINTHPQNMIQSKRRFAQYDTTQKQNNTNTIDLSEGPKLKYEGNLGPKNLEFDIKIVDPYSY